MWNIHICVSEYGNVNEGKYHVWVCECGDMLIGAYVSSYMKVKNKNGFWGEGIGWRQCFIKILKCKVRCNGCEFFYRVNERYRHIASWSS